MRKFKNRLLVIDEKHLGGFIRNTYHLAMNRLGIFLVEPLLRRYRADYHNLRMNIEYRKNSTSLINRLCDKYTTDKGGVKGRGAHMPYGGRNYADFYDLLFRIRRNDVRLLVECGIGGPLSMGHLENYKTGASLRMWKDFFPKASIIGVDVEKDILFSEKRIKTFYCNQTSKKSIEAFIKSAKLKNNSADIIIDDGLHEFHAGITFFRNMNRILAKDGFYIIEDVPPQDCRMYKNHFAENESDFTAHFISLPPPRRKTFDHRLVLITRNT